LWITIVDILIIVLKPDPVIDPVKWPGHGSDRLTRVKKKKKTAFVFLMPNNKNNWQFWICNSHWLPFLPCKTVFSTNQWAIIIEFLRVIIPVATKSEDILTYHQEAGKKEEGRMTLFFIFLIYIYQLVIDIGDARRPSYFYWVILLPQASLLTSKIC